MNFLHLSGIVHRDLKSANLLVTEDLRIKICDFGISRDTDAATMTSNIGTVPWTAPEMFRDVRYCNKVDVYSYGICVWELASRAFPFERMTPLQIITAVCDGVRPAVPDGCDSSLEALMLACWQPTPAQRPSFEQIINMLNTTTQTLGRRKPEASMMSNE